MTEVRRIVLAGALVLVAGGCGSSSERTRSLGAHDAATLRHDIALVRQAARGQDRAKASAALDGAARLVHMRALAGDFSPAQSRAFRRLIARARARIPIDVAAPAVTPIVPPPSPEPQAQAGAKPEKEHGAKKHAKGPK